MNPPVTARPVLTARIAWTASAFVLLVFVITAFVMKTDNAGADFNTTDQVGTVVVGIVVAALLIMPTRPRLYADEKSIRLRSYLGGWRTVPWDVVVRVDFPANLRFARVVLPGDEAFAIYAVQRTDKERSVVVMDQLRALHETVRERNSEQLG